MIWFEYWVKYHSNGLWCTVFGLLADVLRKQLFAQFVISGKLEDAILHGVVRQGGVVNFEAEIEGHLLSTFSQSLHTVWAITTTAKGKEL